jgi:hypothetical protein
MSSHKQEAAFARFESALRTKVTTNMTSEIIDASAKKRQEWQKRHENEEKPLLYRGFTQKRLEEIKKSLAEREKRFDENVEKEIMFRHHPVYQAMFDLLPVDKAYSAETFTGIRIESGTHVIQQGDKVVTMGMGRTLKGAVKLAITVEWQKEYFAKSENYDIDKQVVKLTKPMSERFYIKAKYGSIFDFRKSIIQQMSQIVERFDFEDTRIQIDSEKDIWEFNF